MTQRRGAGEHSIFKRADGTWVAAMDIAPGPNGKRRRIVRKAKTKTKALAELKRAEQQHQESGFVPNQRLTVANYLEFWIAEILPGTVKESTATGYAWIIRSYVTPHIGARVLAKLDPADVQTLLRALEDEGKSVRTRRQVRAVLRSALTRAVRFGYVSRNVAALVDAPRIDEETRRDDTLSTIEIRQLLEVLEDDRLCALADVALRLGLRKGELLALKWSDVDLSRATLRVAGTLKRRDGGGLYVDRPKSAAGNRLIPLSSQLVARLKQHKKQQSAERLAVGAMWGDGGYVFTTPLGTPLDPSNVGAWWHRSLKLAGLPPRPFHSTRRTAITHMAEAGVPLEVAANLVGHSSIVVTADIYNRVRPKAQAAALALVEAHLAR